MILAWATQTEPAMFELATDTLINMSWFLLTLFTHLSIIGAILYGVWLCLKTGWNLTKYASPGSKWDVPQVEPEHPVALEDLIVWHDETRWRELQQAQQTTPTSNHRD